MIQRRRDPKIVQYIDSHEQVIEPFLLSRDVLARCNAMMARVCRKVNMYDQCTYIMQYPVLSIHCITTLCCILCKYINLKFHQIMEYCYLYSLTHVYNRRGSYITLSFTVDGTNTNVMYLLLIS